MRKIASGVYLEDGFPGVVLGLVQIGEEVLLVDSPLRVEDCRSWMATAGDFGELRYMALLDHQLDRVLGARNAELPLVAHDATREEISGWPDTFKGSANPIGAHADRIKRLTGVSKATPDISFSKRMELELRGGEVSFHHHPGVTQGAMWVVLEDRKVLFVGDAVVVKEPPFLGDCDVEAWLATLDDLREDHYRDYAFLSGHDGVVEREDVNAMARFLRMVKLRVERLGEIEDPEAMGERIEGYAEELARPFELKGEQLENGLLRLRAGLRKLQGRLYPSEE